MIREAKLVGFVLLLIAIFAGRARGRAHLGPVTTTHSQVGDPGPAAGGMNMGQRRRPVSGTGRGRMVEAELVVGGMTCGSCAARIERRLNRLDGVAATVNYATGRAYFSIIWAAVTPASSSA